MERRARHGINGKRGQMTVEYSVMFVVIVAVILYAAANVVRPSVNNFFNATSKIVDKATNEINNAF